VVSYLPFELIAAVRFLREGLMQTLLIIIGVSVGVGVIVFMSALLGGLQSNLLNRVLNSQAQIVLLPPQEVVRALRTDEQITFLRIVQKRSQRLRSIDQWLKIRDAMARMPEVKVVSPAASGPAFATRGAATRSVSLVGVMPEQYFKIINLTDSIVAGSSRLTSQDVLIGSDLATDLGVAAGDKLRLSVQSGASVTLTVSGVFDLGNKAFNQRNVFTALSTAQGLLDLTGGASSIDVTLADPYAADTVASVIAAGHRVQADSWIVTNAQFFTAIKSQNYSTIAIRSFVALSVALGIASVMVVSVVQKSKEIGILRAMGATQGQVMRLFLIQGGIVGLFGSVFGSGLAYAILAVWSVIARNPDGTPFFVITIPLSLYAMAAAGATLVGVLAALIPALSAARLDPVVAIRG
jgi:lipoprotein-releasing system permease protein